MNDSMPLQGYLCFEKTVPWQAPSSVSPEKAMPVMRQSPVLTPRTDVGSLASLFAPLGSLKGLGSRGEELLTKVLAKPLYPPRVIDLLWHLPTGYTSRRLLPSLADAAPGGVLTVVVTPIRYAMPPRSAARAPLRVICEDDTGTLDIVFFHADRGTVQRMLPLHEPRLVSGRAERHGAKLQMAHPDYVLRPGERARLPEIEPIYPLTLGLTQKFTHRVISDAVRLLPDVAEWLDAAFVAREGWPSFTDALRVLHQPRSKADLDLWPSARARLAFDEVFSSQLAVALVARGHRSEAGRSLVATGRLSQLMRATLPFTLTRSQELALAEIRSDMAAARKMLRLLHGDVGSGKTVVAALAMANAVEAGTQAALMAPTDVLARQHLETLEPMAAAAGLRLGYLSGREKGRTRKAALERLASGETQFLIGTHALFQPDVVFHDLGLAVVDEQHRFGVAQRLALQDKARNRDADILVMTATPIPRTLLLSVHGDLDVSRLTEKPAGRKPVATRAVPQERIHDVIDGLHRALREGAQAYWVCPAVETDTIRDLTAAEARAAHLRQIFGERVGLVHGKMRGAEKDAAIAAFVARETAILVATTVIEVGVNVPNASVMIIENAELFGLAQLHQLRGRVGRGAAQSSCVLLYKAPLSATGKARLDILRQVDDGFVIAEEDLRLRGGGEVLGPRQSGDPGFRIAPWPQAAALIDTATDQVKYMLACDPALNSAKGRAARLCLHLFERADAARLLQAG